MDKPDSNSRNDVLLHASSLYNEAYNLNPPPKTAVIPQPAESENKGVLSTIGEAISEHPMLAAGATIAAAGAVLYLSRGRAAAAALNASESALGKAGQNLAGAGLRLETGAALKAATTGEALLSTGARELAAPGSALLAASERTLGRAVPGVLETRLASGLTTGAGTELSTKATAGLAETALGTGLRQSESLGGQLLKDQAGGGLRRSLALPVVGLAAVGTLGLSGCSSKPEEQKDKDKDAEKEQDKDKDKGDGTVANPVTDNYNQHGSSSSTSSNNSFLMWWLTRNSSGSSYRPSPDITPRSGTPGHVESTNPRSGTTPHVDSHSTPHVDAPHGTATPSGGVSRGGFGGGGHAAGGGGGHAGGAGS